MSRPLQSPPQCGTARQYRRGCRCELCAEANYARIKELEEQRAEEDSVDALIVRIPRSPHFQLSPEQRAIDQAVAERDERILTERDERFNFKSGPVKAVDHALASPAPVTETVRALSKGTIVLHAPKSQTMGRPRRDDAKALDPDWRCKCPSGIPQALRRCGTGYKYKRVQCVVCKQVTRSVEQVAA